MSATSGIEIPALISGSASALASSGTVTRTMSQPATSRFLICCRVGYTSAVFVVVIDCTEIGASPPTVTLPTLTGRVFRRSNMARKLSPLEDFDHERGRRPADAGVGLAERKRAEDRVFRGRVEDPVPAGFVEPAADAEAKPERAVVGIPADRPRGDDERVRPAVRVGAPRGALTVCDPVADDGLARQDQHQRAGALGPHASREGRLLAR